jgi:acetamidase/formamidase
MEETRTASDYTLSADQSHHRVWDSDIDPGLTVESGSVVTFECEPGSGDDITPETSVEEAVSAPFPGHMLTGPVHVAGAQSGDVLEIELLNVDAGDWGYTLVRPGADGRGLLPEDFTDPYLHHWEISDGTAAFVNGIKVPVRPFPGTIGVAPDESTPQSTIPPRGVGGNLDIRYLTAGSKLQLPVETKGAYFSIGDGHAAQGDGEVCLTSIETSLTVKTRLRLRSDYLIDTPRFHAPSETTARTTRGEFFGTVGTADSLLDASKIAIREMIDWLEDNYGITSYEAYVLCSVAVDLSINELVNDPNWVVTAKLPKSVFPD